MTQSQTIATATQ